jgi:hypothetical protein
LCSANLPFESLFGPEIVILSIGNGVDLLQANTAYHADR